MIIKIGDRLYGDDSGDYVDSDDGDFDHSKEYDCWEYYESDGLFLLLHIGVSQNIETQYCHRK